METKVLVFRSWDDLVFAHRNKSYGAYVIRRAYERRLLLGLGVTTALVAILLLVPGLMPENNILPKIPVIKEVGLKVTSFTPPIKEVQPPRSGASSSPVYNPNKTVRVVSEPVDTEEEFDSTLPSVSTTENGEGGVIDGIGSDVFVEVTPVIVKPKGPVTIAEVMPVYEGGIEAMMKFIQKKMRYPSSAKRQVIEGTVFVSFVVNGDGTVSEVEVIRGIHRDCDKEAMRVISLLPGWIGGSQGGEPVPVRMVLPIKFALQ